MPVSPTAVIPKTLVLVVTLWVVYEFDDHTFRYEELMREVEARRAAEAALFRDIRRMCSSLMRQLCLCGQLHVLRRRQQNLLVLM